MSVQPLLPCLACRAVNRLDPARPGRATCGRCGRGLWPDAPPELDQAAFDLLAARAGVPVLVDFWAPWCGPCRKMAPAFALAASRLAPEVFAAKVDIQAQSALKQRFAVHSVPTLVLLDSGEEAARTSGARDADNIVAWVRESLA